MKKFIFWFIESSADRTKLALTVRGLLAFLVFFDFTNIESVTNDIVEIIFALGAMASFAVSIYGFTRKILNTIVVEKK